MSAELTPSGAGLALDPAPTVGYNTLACAPTDGRAAYVNGDDILVLRGVAAVRLTQSEAAKAPVSSLGFYTPKGRLLLAFTNRAGASLFEDNAQVAQVPSVAGGESRGVAIFECDGAVTLVVGSSVGAVSFHTLGDDFAVATSATAVEHSGSVTAIAALPVAANCATPCVVSVDTSGKVVVHNAAGTMVASRSFETDCATGVQWIDESTFAVSFGSGAVRILDTGCGLRVAWGAHNGWINSMTYHQPSNRLITGAEDGFVFVWALPSPAEASLKMVCHAHLADRLVCGVALDPTGQMLTVIAYDIHKAQSFQLPPW